MAQSINQTVVSGSLIKIMVNGIEVGKARSASARRAFGTEGVYSIGTIMPWEHVYQRYDGSITMDRFFIRNQVFVQNSNNLRSGEFLDYATPRDQVRIAALAEDVLALPIFNMQFMDKGHGYRSQNNPGAGGAPIGMVRVFTGCSIVDYTESHTANAFSGENATWAYLDCINGDAV